MPRSAVDANRARSLDRVTLDTALGVDIEQAIIEVGAAYEVARFGSTAFDLLAGARYRRQEVEINLALTATIETAGLTLSRGRAIARAGGVDWVDPLVGLRVRHQLAPGQELLLRGDVGGFGAGSEFSWNVLGAYGFQIGVYYGTTVSGTLGYRALSVDFEKGSPTAAAFTWAGFYIGGNIGGAWAISTLTDNFTGVSFDTDQGREHACQRACSGGASAPVTGRNRRSAANWEFVPQSGFMK